MEIHRCANGRSIQWIVANGYPARIASPFLSPERIRSVVEGCLRTCFEQYAVGCGRPAHTPWMLPSDLLTSKQSKWST